MLKNCLLAANTRTTISVAGLMWAVSLSVCATEIDGFTEPYRDIDVAASEMGVVSSIDVKEGDRVQSGQLLGKLDEENLQASLEIAKTEMAARGRLNATQAEAAMHEDLLKRVTELMNRQHANEQEVLKARTQRDVFDSQLRTIREELFVRELEYKRIQVQIERRRLHSPIDGVVTRILKDVGEFASPSDPVVFKVVQLDPLLVVFAVPAQTARSLVTTEPVSVVIDGVQHEGFIEFVSPTADPQSTTTRVRVRVPNPGEKMQSGTGCFLKIPDVPSSPPTKK